MSKIKISKHTLADWTWTVLGFVAVLSSLGFNCHHYRYMRAVHHAHVVWVAHHKRYLHHKHLWDMVKAAKAHPTHKNLARLTLGHPWDNAILIVHHDKSTLNPHKWHYDHVHFSHKDSLGRVSYPATAYLARANATGDALRKKQTYKPVGWHQHKYHGNYLLNRGHLIAYSLTKDINFKGKYTPKAVGNLNDPNNLFTETAFCNQQLQYAFETRLRIQLEKNRHIIYQVRPIFRKHELMARGVHLQAISTNKKFQFNVYLFNVQPGVKFDYRNGHEDPDSSYQFKLPNRIIRRSESLDEHDKNMQWQRLIMHLYDNNEITYQQACYDERQILGNYVINY